MKITRSGECGNSPKNAFAEGVAIRLLSGDAKGLALALDDDATLATPDHPDTDGDAAIGERVDAFLSGRPTAIVITHAITHGRVGAVNGSVDIGGGTTAFCALLEFANTRADKVKAIRLYRG